MRLVKLFGHSHKLLLTLQIYYHGLFKIFIVKYALYLVFRILYNKKCYSLQEDSDSSNSPSSGLFPEQVCSLDPWIRSIHRWCLSLCYWDSLVLRSSALLFLCSSLCYMWSLCWKPSHYPHSDFWQQPALSHVLSLGETFPLWTSARPLLLLLRWLLIFWVNTRPSPSVAA